MMRSPLREDILAIASIAKSGLPDALVGRVSGKDSMSLVTTYHKNLEGEMVHKVFAGADPDARIAIACAERFNSGSSGAWIDAVSDFCADKIAGVLLFEKLSLEVSLSKNIARLPENGEQRLQDGKDVLGFLPQGLWDAALPIAYDEDGSLAAISPASKVLEYDPGLSFEGIAALPFPTRMLDTGKASRETLAGLFGDEKVPDYPGAFPVYDATGTEMARPFERSYAAEVLKEADYAGYTKLTLMIADCKDSPEIFPEGIGEFASFLNEILPGSVDEDALFALGKPPQDLEIAPRRYAVTVDLEAGDAGCVVRAAKDLVEICDLVSKTMLSRQIRFCPVEDPKKNAAALKDLLGMLGMDHNLEAWREGVPVDDIVA